MVAGHVRIDGDILKQKIHSIDTSSLLTATHLTPVASKPELTRLELTMYIIVVQYSSLIYQTVLTDVSGRIECDVQTFTLPVTVDYNSAVKSDTKSYT